ncbi:MAG: hypothetical protein LUD77_08265 [Clostridiales bacterium]|nr:hypothetical protein [Clostridiales bacterium]
MLNYLLSVIDSITQKLGSLGTIGLGAGLQAGFKNALKSFDDSLYFFSMALMQRKVETKSMQTAAIVIIRNHNKKSEYLYLLSINCTLSDEEIVRI